MINDESLDRGLTITRCTCLPPTLERPANAGSISVYSPAPQPFRDITSTHNMLRGAARSRGTWFSSEARVQSAALGSLYLESTAGELWVREKVGGGGSALTWNKL